MLVLGFLLGCDRGNHSLAPDVGSQLDVLYQAYAKGDVAQARQSLEKSIPILENATFPKVGAAAHGLWLSYARLHVLEARAGKASLAEAYLLKARYWYLKKLELSGESTEQGFETVKLFTPEKCMELVDQFDKKNTQGSGAAYVKQGTVPNR